MISYAQNFEDVMLARAFGGRNGGFYIDIGACFPDIASVTKHFYDRGWQGINVEPMAEPFARLVAERTRDVNLNIAIAAYTGDIPIYLGPSVGESSALRPDPNARPVLVPCLTLADLCSQYAVQPIDFLKIDVEGLERDVVLSGDWEAFRPAVVVIEVTAPWTTNRRPESAEIGQYLAGNGYREVYFDGINAFYLASEAGELATRFSYPPNVLDRFMPVREAELAAAAEQARQEVNALTSAAAAADLRGREAEARARQEAARAEVAEAQLRDAERRASTAQAEVQRTEILLQEATTRAQAVDEELRRINVELASANQQLDVATRQVNAANQQIDVANLHAAGVEARARHAEASFAAMEQSNSWRLTAPLRRLRRLTRPTAPQHPENPAILGLLRKAVRTAQRSGIAARVAPWVRARYPKLWFRVKRMLLDSPMPAPIAPITRVPETQPSAGRMEPAQAVPSEVWIDALPGSRSVTVEELKILIEQQVVRHRRS